MIEPKTVCLLTAGKGSRMGSMGQVLNKSLFPIDGKAIISHIIAKFPEHTEFVIGLGYLGEQVRNYLNMAHPQQKFLFVEVDNYDDAGSGPGYSLLCCSPKLQKPFYFVSCDTLWDNALDWQTNQNWLGVASVEPSASEKYCNLKISGQKITELRDKTRVDDSSFQSFVGLCFIKDYPVFWQALKNQETVAGEHQVSNGLKALIEQTPVFAQSIEWTDVGDAEKYKEVVSRYENFDFSKQNEALYIINRKVIKFFADSKITYRRVQKSKLNPAVFPEITNHAGQFYAYDFQDGETLYQTNSPQTFQRLLDWLNSSVWKPHAIDQAKMRSACLKFYKEKTLERLDLYHRKYPAPDQGSRVNGRDVPATSVLLEQIPWERLIDGIPRFMHGDLQFDNIIYDQKKDAFKLLDWRQEFAGNIEFGDLYYDLAKLYGGIILNYDYIKLNLLSYHENQSEIFFDFAQRFQTPTYLKQLSDFIESNSFDLSKVRLLVALIYLNMSPLHHFPFDKMLYSLGRDLLDRELQKLR